MHRSHGGGYLYSVCPKSEPLTEHCLQGHSLPFVGSNHTIRYLDGRPELQVPPFSTPCAPTYVFNVAVLGFDVQN